MAVHTGKLKNIEKVWKAEQKQEAEQKNLEELRKQIQEERDRSDLLRLQEQSNGVFSDRLEFLYNPGFAVENQPHSSIQSSYFSKSPAPPAPGQSSVPGALFEEKPAPANDGWRKLHSDPLFLIRKKEQEAIARVKNNPVQMAMIRKSVEETKTSSKHHSDHVGRRHSPIITTNYKRRKNPVKLSEEEKKARFLEMKMDAELLEEHRQKRLKKAAENDAEEAARDGRWWGKNFLDGVQKSAYGVESGGSCTVEERVRRRTYYLQGGSDFEEGKGFSTLR